jgi:hypothetical protein
MNSSSTMQFAQSKGGYANTELHHQHRKALTALTDAGLAVTDIVADGRFHRARKPDDAQWYIANEGTTSTGRHWMQFSAGDFRETGGAYVATVVWRSWQKGDLTLEDLKEIRSEHKQACVYHGQSGRDARIQGRISR